MGVTKLKLSEEEIRSIVKSSFPEQTLKEYTELTEGYCNTAYRLVLDDGQKLILKVTPGKSEGFMRNEINLMDAEVQAMEIVRKETDIRVAKVFCYDKSRALIDGYYFLMEHLEGDSWSGKAEALSEDVNQQISREVGMLQKKLTNVTSDYFGMLGDKEHKFTSQYDFLHYLMTNVIEDAKAGKVDLGVAPDSILCKLESDRHLFDEITTPSLVHWDMWGGNIFIKDDHISGIIDWERAMWADPMMDDRFRFHNRSDAFLEGFGIQKLTPAQEKRILWYDVFLYLTMMTEPTYRQYEDDSQYNWVKPLFIKVWGNIR